MSLAIWILLTHMKYNFYTNNDIALTWFLKENKIESRWLRLKDRLGERGGLYVVTDLTEEDVMVLKLKSSIHFTYAERIENEV